MKKPALIASITAGVILIGGGGWAATTLATNDEGSTTAVETPAPTNETTPEPTVEPTPDVTPTPTVEPTTTPTPEPTYSDEERIFLDWATPLLAAEDVQMAEDEMLGYLYAACEEIAAGDNFPYVVPTEIDDESGTVNSVFRGGAKNGYGPEITGEAGSYCD